MATGNVTLTLTCRTRNHWALPVSRWLLTLGWWLPHRWLTVAVRWLFHLVRVDACTGKRRLASMRLQLREDGTVCLSK
jgi:hypothetical protein